MKKNAVKASYTHEEVVAMLEALLAMQAKAPTAKAPKATKKAAKKVAKPGEGAKAIAAWKEAHNRTDATIAAYKAIRQERYAADWAAWVASEERNALKGVKRAEANAKKNAELNRAYEIAAGMKY